MKKTITLLMLSFLSTLQCAENNNNLMDRINALQEQYDLQQAKIQQIWQRQRQELEELQRLQIQDNMLNDEEQFIAIRGRQIRQLQLQYEIEIEAEIIQSFQIKEELQKLQNVLNQKVNQNK